MGVNKKTRKPDQASNDVDALLKDIAFTAPVEVSDCMALATALKATVPGASVEVHFHTGSVGDTVIVRVNDIVRRLVIA